MSRGDLISRQWQILQLLEARRMGVSVPDLADELDCNVRNIYRDMDALGLAGFPIYSDKDDGVEKWKFVEGYKHRMPIPLEMTEIMALVIARDHLKPFEGTVFSGALSSAFEKIKAMLKPESHVFLEGLAKSFHVGLSGKKDYRKYRETVDILNRAVIEHLSVVIKYRSIKKEELDRKIDPYHVWFMGGTIYIVAYCHERKEIRLFVLDRIVTGKLTDEKFEVPSSFSMEKFTEGKFRVVGGKSETVRILFDSYIAHYVKERVWHPSQKIEEKKDGSIILTMTVEGLMEVRSWVMSFGSHAEVLEPKDFRKDIEAELKKAVKHYTNP